MPSQDRVGHSSDRRGCVTRFGDVTVTGTYRFYDDPRTGTDAALILGVKAPTGGPTRSTRWGLFEKAGAVEIEIYVEDATKVAPTTAPNT